MQRTLERVASSLDVGVRMRIGVNTGEVLVGALRAGGDYTAMGDVVNIAQRLQIAAKPGEVVVGPATHAATHRVVRYEPLGDLTVKGRDVPVPAWVAREAILPPGYRPNRRKAPLVGRDAELSMLRSTIDTAVTHRRTALLLVIGEAGVGKSRLAEEVAESAGCDHDALVLEGRCVPYGEANVWWPVAEALRQSCGIGGDEVIDRARELAELAVRAAWPTVSEPELERVLNGLLYLMGYDVLRDVDSARAREEAIWALATFAERSSRQRPVVVVLSDLHWADDVVFGLLDTMLERLERTPTVLLATARRTLAERWTPPPGGYHRVSIHLDPLPHVAARELLVQLTGVELDDALTEVLLDRGGGNPFYLEELVALLTESGVVGVGHDSGGATNKPVVLPDTLRGLVAARLDALVPRERRLLDGAAVIGHSGPVIGLCVMDEVAFGFDGKIDEVLASVVAKDLLVLEGDIWSFRSELVREVAYGMLTKSERAKLHAGIAHWMETHEKFVHDAVIDRIAYHWTRAAELAADVGATEGVPRDVTERALSWIERAAARAEVVGVPLVASRLFADGLELVGDEPTDRRHRFLLGRASALGQLRELTDARECVVTALDDARTVADPEREADAQLVLADIEQKEGALGEADAHLERLIGVFARLGDDHRRAEALRLRAMGALLSDDLDLAQRSASEARALFGDLGDRRGEAWALQHLSWVAFIVGRLDEAEELLNTSAATFADLGDSGGLGWALGLLAYTRFHQGHAEEAEPMAEDMAREARERGDRWALGMMLVLTATIRLWSGRTESAADRAEEAARLFEAIGDKWGEVQARMPLGRALVALGRVDEAFEALEPVRRFAEQAPDQPKSFMMGGLLGTAVHVGDVERATAIAAATPDINVGTSDAPVANGERETAVALIELMRGDPAAALARLEHLTSTPGRWADSPYPKSAQALAASATGRSADAQKLADAVLGDAGASYLDKLTAGVAKGLALARDGDDTGALAALAEVRDAADATEDRVARALARLGEGFALETLGRDGGEALADASRRLGALGIDASGWYTAYREAAGATRAPAA
jgi:tetratricopeptide (TPR) repeat protein